MAEKVTVTAQSDFFDRANQTTRRKGDVFVVKADHAKTLDVKVSEPKEKKQMSDNPGATSKKKK